MRKWLLALALLPLASPAWAACSSPIAMKDATGATVDMDASSGSGANCAPQQQLVQGGSAVAAGNALFTQGALQTSGGWTPGQQAALSTTVEAIKASAGELGNILCYNPNATVAYVQVFNVAAASVTLGSTAPNYIVSVPATSNGGYSGLPGGHGMAFGTAISFAATTTPTGSTAPGTGLTCSYGFN